MQLSTYLMFDGNCREAFELPFSNRCTASRLCSTSWPVV